MLLNVLVLVVILAFAYVIWKKPKPPPEIWAKILRFILFGTIFALLPFAFDANRVYNESHALTWYDVFHDGSLYLVSAGIGFSAAGELLGHTEKHRELKVAFGGLAFLAAVAEAGFYGEVHVLGSNVTASQALFIGTTATNVSMWLFVGTFLVGLVCIVLSEVK